MNISITDQIVSEFLSGLVVILVLIAVGGILSAILRGMMKKYPFTQLALILALAPLSLVKFLDRGGSSTLYLYAMIVTLLGITIDGINHVLLPKERPKAVPDEAEEEDASTTTDPEVIVWEKAE